MIELPATAPEIADTWQRLFVLSGKLEKGWTIVGGQMVHLHCAESNVFPIRATNDVDAVIDIRARKHSHHDFTKLLHELGFSVQETPDGIQHRWTSEVGGQIDVLQPQNHGRRFLNRLGFGGGPTIATPGAQQALNRSERVPVSLGNGIDGMVNRPNLLGALLIKGAAFQNMLGENHQRHITDFVTLASLSDDPRVVDNATIRERRYLEAAIFGVSKYPDAAAGIEGGADAVNRIEQRLKQLRLIDDETAHSRNVATQEERRKRNPATG